MVTLEVGEFATIFRNGKLPNLEDVAKPLLK